MDSLTWPGLGTANIELAAVPRILGDLVAGLGAHHAALHRRAPDGSSMMLVGAGRFDTAPPAPPPDLADGTLAQPAPDGEHLGLAARQVPDGQLILAVRRGTPFDAPELRLLHGILQALAVAHARLPER